MLRGKELQRKISDYLDDCEFVRQLAPKTIKEKRRLFQEFSEYFYEDGLNAKSIRDYIKKELQKGRKKTGVGKEVKDINAFIRWLYRRDLIDEDITYKIDVPKSYTKKPPYASAETIEKIIMKGTDPTKHSHSGHIESQLEHRDAMIFAYSAGLRAGEVISMRREWIDLERETYMIIEKGSIEPKEMNIPLNCYKMLEKRSKGKGVVFKINREGLNRYIKRGAERIGYKGYVKFHLLRHSFISELLLQGVPIQAVQKAARHKDAQTTLKYYANVDDKKVAEFINNNHPIIQKDIPLTTKIKKLKNMVENLKIGERVSIEENKERYVLTIDKTD